MRDRTVAGGKTPHSSRTSLVRSVERAVHLLEALLASPNGMRLVDLSEQVGLHKTTAFRLLHTLIATSLVRKDHANDRYHWDPLRWMLVAGSQRDTPGKLDLVRSLLQDLANATGQTALLAVPDGLQRNMVQVACVVPSVAVRVDMRDRRSAPLHAVASGKLYLSTMSPASVTRYLQQDLPAFTPDTITRAELILEQLAQIRRQGHALSRQEFVLNAGGVSLPVSDEHDTMVGALELIAPLDQFTESNLAVWLPQMRTVAAQLAQLLRSVPVATTEQPSGSAALGEEVSSSGMRLRKNYRVL